jgi:hypothetical protein
MFEVIDEIRPRNAERAALRDRVIFWLGIVFLAAVVSFLTNAYATEIPMHVVEHHDGVKMRLLSSPCVDKVSKDLVATAPEKFQGRAKAIASEWRAKDGSWAPFAGCWFVVKKGELPDITDDVFVLVFADGAVVQVYRNDLLKKAGPGV